MKPIISIVMPGLDPGIHGSLAKPCRLRVDGRVKPYEIHTSLPSFQP